MIPFKEYKKLVTDDDQMETGSICRNEGAEKQESDPAEGNRASQVQNMAAEQVCLVKEQNLLIFQFSEN